MAVPRVVAPEVERWVLLGGAERDDLRRPRHDRRLEHLRSWVARHPRRAVVAEHVVGGLMSYWVYQHLGNLSPERDPTRKACSRELIAAGDGTRPAATWAARVRAVHTRARRLPVQLLPRPRAGAPGRGRLPQRPGARAGQRAMVDDDEWRVGGRALPPSVRSPADRDVAAGVRARRAARPAGWNEAVCDGALGPAVAVARRAHPARPSTSRTGRRSTARSGRCAS